MDARDAAAIIVGITREFEKERSTYEARINMLVKEADVEVKRLREELEVKDKITAQLKASWIDMEKGHLERLRLAEQSLIQVREEWRLEQNNGEALGRMLDAERLVAKRLRKELKEWKKGRSQLAALEPKKGRSKR